MITRFKEFIMKIFLFIFKVFFSLFNFLLQKEKTIFVTTYADNSLYVMNTLKKQVPNEEIIVLTDKRYPLNHQLFENNKQYVFNDIKKPLQFFQSIYHLATSRIIFLDDYFDFIAGIPINRKQIIIQLGHGVGAIKTFGLKDKQVKSKPLSKLDRYQFNYDQIDYFTIGSDRMGDLFMSAFNTTNEHLIRTGVPSTDFFFNELEVQRVKKRIEDTYPFIKNKKVILYAPTYRENDLTETNFEIDYHQLSKSIGNDYVLLVKYHPKLNTTFVADVLPEFVYDVSTHENVNELLTAVDLLITDYSSLPFEYALLNRPMIFYVPDLDTYTQSKGLWEPLENNLPGPITTNMDELIKAVNHHYVNQKQLNDFNLRWNTYSVGQSSRDLIDIFYQ